MPYFDAIRHSFMSTKIIKQCIKCINEHYNKSRRAVRLKGVYEGKYLSYET